MAHDTAAAAAAAGGCRVKMSSVQNAPNQNVVVVVNAWSARTVASLSSDRDQNASGQNALISVMKNIQAVLTRINFRHTRAPVHF